MGRAVAAALIDALENHETITMVSEYTGIPVEEIMDIKRASSKPTSLDKPIGEDGDETRGAFLASDDNVEEEVISNDRDARIHRLIDDIREKSSRDAEIIEMTYGLGDYYRPMTRTSVARAIGIKADDVDRSLKRSHLYLQGRLDKTVDSVV